MSKSLQLSATVGSRALLSATVGSRADTATFRPFAKNARRFAPLVPQNTSQSSESATTPAGLGPASVRK